MDPIEIIERETPAGVFTAELRYDFEPEPPEPEDVRFCLSRACDSTLGTDSPPVWPRNREDGLPVAIRYVNLTGGVAVGVRYSTGYVSRLYTSDDPNGMVWVDREVAEREWPNREQAVAYLEGCASEWDMYLQGDIYGYIIKDPTGEELDALWGMYGYEYAKSMADDALRRETSVELREAEYAARLGIPTLARGCNLC